MRVIFYNCKSDNRKLNKSITQLASVECDLKENCSLLSPSFELSHGALNDYARCNYMYVPDFHRYYFASVNALYGDRLQVNGDVDVLMTYANQIRALNVTITRQQNMYNDYLIDNQLPIRQTKEIQFASVGTYSAGMGIYLTVDGGEVNG